MPGDYTEGTFTECQGDSAYPPGIYPLANGSTSTFAQRYTGTYTDGAGSVGTYTVGQTVTPQTPYSTPASSMCTTYSTIGNGAAIAVSTSNGTSAMNSTMSASANMTSTMTSSTSSKASASATGAAAAVTSAKSSASGAASSAASSASSAGFASFSGVNYGPVVAGALSVLAVVAGAGVLVL